MFNLIKTFPSHFSYLSLTVSMRTEENSLDLNNLPDDYSRDSEQVFEDSNFSGYRKKKNGAKDGKDQCGKVYQCRFCSLKFCKSQALGGHMNRHRQERETETLNRARQLVFSNDNIAAPHHLECPSYHPAGHLGDPTLSFRSNYPPRLYSGSSSTLLPQPPPPPYLYSSPSRLVPYRPSHQYPQRSMNDYYVGHALSSSYAGAPDSNYTCIGAPVAHGFGPGAGRGLDLAGSGGGRDGSLHNLQDEGLNWGRICSRDTATFGSAFDQSISR